MIPFHPIVVLPEDRQVLDLTGVPPERRTPWTIGRYDEVRANFYTQPLFAGGRCVHMGIDLGGPKGVAVHAFDPGLVVAAGINEGDGNYGPTLVCAHVLEGRTLYVLLGHLARTSLERSPIGTTFARGAVLGWLGEESENGGWPPHVHVQLSWEQPEGFDLPGAVTLQDREAMRERFPDPRRILGSIY